MREFPQAECVVASLFDLPSLECALTGIEGAFIVTPSPFNEAVAMENLVGAVRKRARLHHLVRIVGYEPESLARRVPEALRHYEGTAQQHYVAKRILDDSDLPVTYLNIGATYLDNFLLAAPGIKRAGRMIWPQRAIPVIDPRDVGEVAACLLLSPDQRNVHQFLTINNGQDLLSTSEVVEVLADVLKVRLAHEPDHDAFIDEYGQALARRRGVADVAEKIWQFFEYEQGNSAFLSLNDCAERILGRKPTSLRSWFNEHREYFTPETSPAETG